MMIQCRHLIPAPVDRTFANVCLYKHPWIACQKYKPGSLMIDVTCESKLRSVVRSFIYPCPGNSVAIGRVVVYHTWSVTHLVQKLNAGTLIQIQIITNKGAQLHIGEALHLIQGVHSRRENCDLVKTPHAHIIGCPPFHHCQIPVRNI